MRPFIPRWRDAVASADLTPTQKAVAWRASDYANLDGRNVFPGSVRLALDCGLSVRDGATQNSTVDATFSELVKAGLAVKVASGHRGQAAQYRLVIPSESNRGDGC